MSAVINTLKSSIRFITMRQVNKILFYKNKLTCPHSITYRWPTRIHTYWSRRNADKRTDPRHFVLLSGFLSFFTKEETEPESELTVLWSALMSFFRKEETEPESELILTMKRSVLLMQKGEAEKAEQMLHLALKLAQELQNPEAVTYIYDLMANLAYESEDYDKAEPLFVSVMQRLLSTGTPQNDNKVVHISLKIADIFKKKHEPRKAENGFKFCMQNLQEKVDEGVNDEDTMALWGMTLDWYGRFLLEENRAPEALKCFEKAYQMSLKVNGENHEQTVVLLNDLGTVSFLCEDYDHAIQYLNEAVRVGSRLSEMHDFAAVHVNLGAIYMKKQMYEEARRSCERAWVNAKRHDNKVGMDEANACLDEIKNVLHSKQ